jgi:hypothetical protein
MKRLLSALSLQSVFSTVCFSPSITWYGFDKIGIATNGAVTSCS